MSEDEIIDQEEQEEDPEHKLDDWVVVFESAETMEVELVEARLADEGIEFYTHNKREYRNNVGLGTSWGYTSGIPCKVFVKPEDLDKAIAIIDEDRSKLLEDPNLDFGEPEDQ